MKKILIINRVIGLWRGGGETFDFQIAELMKKSGVDVEFLTSKKLFSRTACFEDRYPFHYVRTPYLRDIKNHINIRGLGRIYMLDLWIFSLFVLRFLAKNRSILDQVKLVQVMADPLLARRITERFGVKTVTIFHGFPDRWQHKEVRDCPCLFAVGDVYQSVAKINPKTRKIRLGLDDDFFLKDKNLTIKKDMGLLGKRTILYVGRLVKGKNVELLLRLFSEISSDAKDLYLLVVGEGNQKIKLQRLAKKLGLEGKVRFLGHVKRALLKKYYLSADVLVLLSEYESFSFVVLEAMACGLPIIVSDVGEMRNIVVDSFNGCIVDLSNKEEIKKSILNLLDNRDLLESMSKASVSVSKSFSVSNAYHDVVCEYLRMVQE